MLDDLFQIAMAVDVRQLSECILRFLVRLGLPRRIDEAGWS